MRKIILTIIILLAIIQGASAVADFRVTAFACSPNEVKLGEQFSCTATMQNNGDSAGALSTVTLYPDNTNWLEKSSYPVTSGASVSSGASTEVTFSNLKAKKSGNSGFSKIMLDSVTDTYVADNLATVNSVDIVATATSSESSAASGGTVDVTGQATIGGNADTTLTFRVNSGGCSIGNQDASATTTGMTTGQTLSHAWTVTIGSSTCSYTVEGKVLSTPSGIASKTDSSTGTITCSSGCSSSDSGSSGGGGSSASGGGGGSSSAATTPKQTITANVKANVIATLKVTKTNIPFRELFLTLSTDKASINLTVEKLSEQPSTTPALVGTSLGFLSLEKSGFENSDVTSAKISFEVAKAELEAKNIQPEDVALFRYTTQWDELETTSEGLSGTVYKFTAMTPGFSYFAIASKKTSAKTEEETTKVTTPETTEEVKTQEPKTEMPKGTQWLIPIVFLAIIGLAAFLYRKYEM